MNERLVLQRFLERSRAESFTVNNLCHPKQARAVGPGARRRVVCAGRRGGKSLGGAVAMLADARAGKRQLYVTVTRLNAKEIIWDDLCRLNQDHALGGDVHLGSLSIDWRNGGTTRLAGANNEREIAKIRGKKWHKVIVDECQSIPDRVLVPLLGPVLAPTLLDYGGELWLMGSRPAVRAGRWFEITEGKLAGNYEQHRFDVRDNTMLPARLAGRSIEDILDEFRRDEGWTEGDITYQREVLNRDIQDLDSLLYVQPQGFEDRPGGDWTYVLGVDQGHDDSDAIAVLGWSHLDPRLFLVEEFVQSKQDVTDLANAIKERIERYRPSRIVIDQGGGGKKSAEEIRRRHRIPLDPAEKSDKPGFIRLINADLRKGLLVAKADSRFAEDCKLVQRCPKALLNGELREKPRRDGGYHSDITDAVLYGWRAARHYQHQPAPPPPPSVADQLEQQALLEHHREREAEWWEKE